MGMACGLIPAVQTGFTGAQGCARGPGRAVEGWRVDPHLTLSTQPCKVLTPRSVVAPTQKYLSMLKMKILKAQQVKGLLMCIKVNTH